MSDKNPFVSIVRIIAILVIVAFVGYIGVQIAALADPDYNRIQIYHMVSGQIESLILAIWEFIRPFIQIIILLVIVDWVFRRVGIDIRSKTTFNWNAPSLIVFIIVGAFALAALTGVQGATYLKDLALVAVGFFFGSQKMLAAPNGRGSVDENKFDAEQ